MLGDEFSSVVSFVVMKIWMSSTGSWKKSIIKLRTLFHNFEFGV